MKTTIIYAHPNHESLNYAILAHVEQTLNQQNRDYNLIDLYRDNFNPVLAGNNFDHYMEGKSEDMLVSIYQKQIKESDELVFIFPIWWYTEPAILKGFIDKVMLYNYSFGINDDFRLYGLLTQLKKATIITTASMSKDYLINHGGNYIEDIFINNVLKIDMGVQDAKWYHIGDLDLTTKAEKQNAINQIKL